MKFRKKIKDLSKFFKKLEIDVFKNLSLFCKMSDSEEEKLEYDGYQEYFERNTLDLDLNFTCKNAFCTKLSSRYWCGDKLTISDVNDIVSNGYSSHIVCFKGEKASGVFYVCSQLCQLKMEIDIYEIDPTAITQSKHSILGTRKFCPDCSNIVRDI